MENYERLSETTFFGDFLNVKFNTKKRFGLEGCEAFIPGVKACIDSLSEAGITQVVLGMNHRGRTLALAKIVNKPMEVIFAELSGKATKEAQSWGNLGDVQYHLGASCQAEMKEGRVMQINLLPNPSHLESVNPVVAGRVRAEQFYKDDLEHSTVCAIQVHGDSSYSGQGVVYETMQMSKLKEFSTGGQIHFILNNQIGFTTPPMESRSSLYCTDLAKTIQAPIIHVNADDVEAVTRVCKIAAEFRMKFRHDVIVDIVGYRKFGHNEMD